MAPIPLAAVDEEFELERPYDMPTTVGGGARAKMAPEGVEDEFQLEAPHEAPTTGWAASIRPLPVAEDSPRRIPPSPAAPSASPSALISPTLGELYFNQGFTDKAIEVYRELSGREPSNERLGARLRELEQLESALTGGGLPAAAADRGVSQPGPSADRAPADRREAIERTIVRLEGLLSAIRKG